MEEDPDNYDGGERWTADQLRRINAPRRPFEVTWLRIKVWLREHPIF